MDDLTTQAANNIAVLPGFDNPLFLGAKGTSLYIVSREELLPYWTLSNLYLFFFMKKAMIILPPSKNKLHGDPLFYTFFGFISLLDLASLKVPTMGFNPHPRPWGSRTRPIPFESSYLAGEFALCLKVRQARHEFQKWVSVSVYQPKFGICSGVAWEVVFWTLVHQHRMIGILQIAQLWQISVRMCFQGENKII